MFNKQFHRMQGLADLASILYEHGIEKAILCPGSRNAPIINTLVSFGKIECVSLTDERSAAYFALGVAQQTRKPVVINCTSGTASLNLAPALAEAFYQGIPLIAITADRPPEWIDQADNQAIRQNGIFHNFVKSEVTLPVETSHPDDLWYFRRKTAETLKIACEPKAGPVHLNIPFREPLYDELPRPSVNLHSIKSEIPGHFDFIDFEKYLKKWNLYSRKMIVVGVSNYNPVLNQVLSKFAGLKDTVVIAENLSNISAQNIISSPELLFSSITEADSKDFAPELLMTIGDNIVSKKLKLFLRKYPATEHWHLDPAGNFTDTYQQLSKVIQTEPVVFLEMILKNIHELDKGFNILYQNRYKLIQEKLNEYHLYVQFSDLKVIHTILNALPGGYDVQLANSAPVRLSQMADSRKDIQYFSNRGTSGIDGCVSTAAGAAYASGKPTLLICGDLAFIYDSNGLWNTTFPKNLKILVLNNQGGNIFSMIKTGVAYKKIKNFIETPHNVKINELANSFGLKHLFADNDKDFIAQLSFFLALKESVVFEVKTIMEENTKVYKQLLTEIENCIPALVQKQEIILKNE